jgi:hypothetical protein
MNKNYLIFCFFAGALAWSFALYQQDPDGAVHLYNPSFEDTPRASASPAGWRSWTPGSTPDIMPGAWGVDFAPQDGQSCVALVTREDGTVEDISQALSEPLLRDTCYTLSIYLAHSDQYVGYNLPGRIRIWGGEKPGVKTELLSVSPLISNQSWKMYRFRFVPTRDLRSITLEAFYAPGTLFKYRGNILLDNCSEIKKCNRA